MANERNTGTQSPRNSTDRWGPKPKEVPLTAEQFEEKVAEYIAAGEVAGVNPYSGWPFTLKFSDTRRGTVNETGPTCPSCGLAKLTTNMRAVIWCFGCGHAIECPSVELENDVMEAKLKRKAHAVAQQERLRREAEASRAAKEAKKAKATT